MPRLLLPMFILCLLAGAGCESAVTPDLILTGGHVRTLQTPEPDPAPTAVAIADGRIVYVGSDAGALALGIADNPPGIMLLFASVFFISFCKSTINFDDSSVCFICRFKTCFIFSSVSLVESFKNLSILFCIVVKLSA